MSEARIEIALDDGCLDAFVACPDGRGRRPPILLLADRQGVTPQVETLARRLAARDYFVLAPDWPRRPSDDRREDAEAWLDHICDDPQADDARVGVLGYGAGADLALRVAAWRSERIAGVAAFGGRGFAPPLAREAASRINGLVRLGYPTGPAAARAGHLEAALCAAGVDFDVEVYAAEPSWTGILDVFGRALAPSAGESGGGEGISPASFNP